MSFKAPKPPLTALFAALLCSTLTPRPAAALNVNAVYRAACEREVGVILRVEKRHIYLLKRSGEISKIPRHEIVSLVYYPVAQFPLAKLPRSKSVKPVRIFTREQRKWEELAFGWPINFSERKMSLLLPSGEDFTVEKASVWSLSFDGFSPKKRPAPPPMPLFQHPQTSGFCAAERRPRPPRRPATSQPATSQPATSQPAASQPAITGEPGLALDPKLRIPTARPSAERERARAPSSISAAARSPARQRIFPQQILNDQVVIRRELDRLMRGYQELIEDIGDQIFYPVPQLYKDRTSLGFWGSFFSRYAASESRSNNLTPLLTNTYSSGPFRYQHIFFTGSTPNGILIHNEAQTQIFYRFKAAYFHASLLVDPNLALVGENYFWRKEDLASETLDDRVNEFAIVELGFDIGPVAIQLQPVSMAQGAVKHGDIFDTNQAIPLWRAGGRLSFPDLTIEVMAGYSISESDISENNRWGRGEWAYAYGRLNLRWDTPWHHITLRSWTVVRHLTHTATFGGRSQDKVEYRSLSVSSALQMTYLFLHRFKLGAHLIIEIQSRALDRQIAQVRALPKLSLFASMSF